MLIYVYLNRDEEIVLLKSSRSNIENYDEEIITTE